MRIFEPDAYLLASASDEERRRARRIVAYASALGVYGYVFMIYFAVVGPRELSFVLLGTSSGIAGTLLVLRAFRSTSIAGHWLQLMLMLGLGYFTYETGSQGPGLLWFELLPILALLSNGPRAGIIWAIIGGVCISGVYVLELSGHRFESQIDPDNMRVLAWASIITVIAMALWGVFAFERIRERNNRELLEANRRLTETLERADAASLVKTAFLANTSHELRTPMNGVVGMTSLLMTTDLTSEQREYVETIHESAESLLSVIDDILVFSQLEAGKLQLARVEFDLRDRLDPLITLLAERIGARRLDLIAIVDESIPDRLMGDPVRFQQVLTNLLDNALKFTDEGEVVLEVGMAAQDGDIIELAVSVKDTGIGIATDDQLRLFERFTQVDTSSARRYGGTGLGLAISKQLVERMGGRIGLESEPGRGSTFRFTARFERGTYTERRKRRPKSTGRALIGPMGPGLIAFVKSALTTRGLSYEAASTEEDLFARMGGFDVVIVDFERTAIRGPRVVSLSRGKEGTLKKPVRMSHLDATLERVTADDSNTPCKILVVEDNAVNQLVAATMIERLGYSVQVVASGQEALVHCESNDYGAIVMDCHMPEMDGFETAAAIRRREGGGERTPIIALTASAASEYRARCLAAGMDDFLTKPIELDTMQTVLSRWVRP